MFLKIFAVICNATKGISSGGTGYLDGIRVHVPSKGLDSCERPFFTLPLEVSTATTLKDGGIERDSVQKGSMTFFQRYAERTDIWTTGGMDSGLCGSAIKTEAYAAFVESALLRVLKGETVTVEVPKSQHGWDKMEVTLRLLKPEECNWTVTTEGADPAPRHSEKMQVLVTRM